MRESCQQALAVIGAEFENLSEEEHDFVRAVMSGRINWKRLDAEALALYEAVIGDSGKETFNRMFLPRVRTSYPDLQEAGIIMALHVNKASWLQPPKTPGDYFTALEFPAGKGTLMPPRLEQYLSGGIQALPWPADRAGTSAKTMWTRYFMNLHEGKPRYRPTCLDIVEAVLRVAITGQPLLIPGIGVSRYVATYKAFHQCGYELPQATP